MGTTVIVDGQVVYGDPAELKNVQLAEVTKEIERLTTDVQRVMASLDVVKESFVALLGLPELRPGQFATAKDAEAHVKVMEEVMHPLSIPPSRRRGH